MVTCTSCGRSFASTLPDQTVCDSCQELHELEPGSASPLARAAVAGHRLERRLGIGRFAETWLATGADGRSVIVKLLHAFGTEESAVGRFHAEAVRLAGALLHPAIARPIWGGAHLASSLVLVYRDEIPSTLEVALSGKERWSPAHALELCAQIADGLEALHAHGVLHRNLKPANIGLLPERGGLNAVLLDGATHHLALLAGMPLRPAPKSTGHYLAPEEWERANRTAEPRADLYALGALLHHLLTGRPPFWDAPEGGLAEAHRSQPPPRLGSLGITVHPEVEALLSRLLAKRPSDRLETAAETAVLLRAMLPLVEGPGALRLSDVEAATAAAPPPPPLMTPVPRTLPRPLSPALEASLARALLGEVVLEPPAAAGGGALPARGWMAALLPIAAAAGIAGILQQADRVWSPPLGAPERRVVAAPAPPAPVPSTAPAPPAPVPSTAPAPPAAPSPAPAAAPGPSAREAEAGVPSLAAPPAPAASALDRARRLLLNGEPRAAQAELLPLLKAPDAPRDQLVQAQELMGDAEASRGRRSQARRWYSLAAGLSSDRKDRLRLEAKWRKLSR